MPGPSWLMLAHLFAPGRFLGTCSGFGGVLYMMLGTAYILMMAGFAIQPTLVLYRWEAGYGNFNGLILLASYGQSWL